MQENVNSVKYMFYTKTQIRGHYIQHALFPTVILTNVPQNVVASIPAIKLVLKKYDPCGLNQIFEEVKFNKNYIHFLSIF